MRISRAAAAAVVGVALTAVALGACSSQTAGEKAAAKATQILRGKLPLYMAKLESAALGGDLDAVRAALRSGTILRWDEGTAATDIDAALYANAAAESNMESVQVTVAACINIVIVAGTVPEYRDIECPPDLRPPSGSGPIASIVTLF